MFMGLGFVWLLLFVVLFFVPDYLALGLKTALPKK